MAADDALKDQLNTVQAAARLVFYQNAGKQRLVNQLALAARRTNHRLGNVQMTLEDAAQAAWIPPKDLLAQLKADSCFKLLMKPGRTPGASAQYFVGLDVQKTVSTARGLTKTGFLSEELAPSKGYVGGLHPIRPGQPNCTQFVKFGECAFNERCVYHHPGKPSGNQHKSPQAATHTGSSRPEVSAVSSAAAAQTSRAPAPLKTAWGSAGQALTGAPTGQQQQQQPQRPAWGAAVQIAPPAAAGTDAGSSSSIPSMPGSVAGPQAVSSAMQAAAQAPQQPWTHLQQQAVQPQQHPRPPPPPALPAAHPVEQVRQPCHMLLLRGFCPMGANCPYKHHKPAGAGSQTHTVAPIQTADLAAPTTEGQHDTVISPLSAQAEPSTPVPAPPATRPQPAAVAAQAPASTAAAAGQRTWKDLLAGPPTQQQQQQQQAQQHQGGTAVSSEASTPRSVPPGQAAKLMGWTDGCLPQLWGAPNCPFFMGTGTCKFMERCVYHHPTAADHPECVARGELPKRYNANNRPSYGRLINHLYRVWDYDSCVEAQLKIWLARHLLGRNNPGSQMFSKDACRPAVPAQGRGFYWQAMGPYTCSLGEAGEVLHHMWRAQPDEASKQAMPYTKQLRELLTGDPYFAVAVDKKCPSHFWVKLNVDKIKSTLNF